MSDHPAAPGSDDAILGRLMLAFEGTELPAWMADRLASAPAAGVTIFRHVNVENAGQVRELTDAVQAAAPGGHPLLVAADQEGGQLNALADGTPFAGNMALGAVGDDQLAERVGRATGARAARGGYQRELRAGLRPGLQPRQPRPRRALVR